MMTARESGCKVEILAPAGGHESLLAAVRCGAGAVYLGGAGFNARRSAQNFDDEALQEAVRYCHIRGVKVYLTLNTLVFDEEIPALLSVLRMAGKLGVDALIVQDLAVARLARRHLPGLALHASTQMSVHNAQGVRALASLGFRRVVLARELSREEIAEIRVQTAECGIELECFVHGALCMSVSGQCTLSAMIGGRSGNRGLCAQPCRLPFARGGREHALSLKDLSLIGSAGELASLGVCSLKIEGRMKRPEYVAAAVTACRAVLEGREPDYAALEAVFSRSGFTRGYYDSERGLDMFGTRRREDIQSAAPVLAELAALYKDETPRIPLDLLCTLERGRPSALWVLDVDGAAILVTGPVPQEARTAPTDKDKIAAAFSKTGGTPYWVRSMRSTVEEGLMLPVSALNAMRRQALSEVTALRGALRPHDWREMPEPRRTPHSGQAPPPLRARLARAGQLSDALAERVEQIILPLEEFAHLDDAAFAQYREKLRVEIPEIAFDNLLKLEELLQNVKRSGVAGAVVGGLGGIELAQAAGLALHGGAGLNAANSEAMEGYAALGLCDITLSIEMDLPRIRALGGGLPRGILAYGHLPLMAMRNCPIGDCAACGRDFPELTDRLGNRFPVDCTWQVARLYNCMPLDVADRLEELRGLDFLTLYFTRESSGDCVAVAERYLRGEKAAGKLTRGLLYRKVR